MAHSCIVTSCYILSTWSDIPIVLHCSSSFLDRLPQPVWSRLRLQAGKDSSKRGKKLKGALLLLHAIFLFPHAGDKHPELTNSRCYLGLVNPFSFLETSLTVDAVCSNLQETTKPLIQSCTQSLVCEPHIPQSSASVAHHAKESYNSYLTNPDVHPWVIIVI